MPVYAGIELADSIISRMHSSAESYMDYIQEYHAKVYVKAQLDVIKKNRAFRYIPGLFRAGKHNNRYFAETLSDLHFTAPAIYDRKVKAFSGTLKDTHHIPGLTGYFHINVYRPYLIGNTILSPLAPNSRRYYRYTVDSVSYDSLQRIVYHIRFIPRNKSSQLIDGQMSVTEGTWSVRDIRFKGHAELLHFECHLFMGEIGSDTEFLPVRNHIKASYSFMGNVLEGYYEAYIDYRDVRNKDNATVPDAKKRDYNLTASFSLQCDRTAYTKDTTMLDTLRAVPLSESERYIYKRYQETNDSSRQHLNSPSVRRDRWRRMGDFMLTDSKWMLGENVVLRCAPFINPFLFSYGKNNGASYRQDFKFNTRLHKDRSIDARIRLGYNFTDTEFYWSIRGNYNYQPEHLGYLYFNVGNGNRISNSRIVNKLKELPSASAVNLDNLNLERFEDLNAELSNHIEIYNGLWIDLGLTFHHRTPARPPSHTFRNTGLPEDLAEGLRINVRPQYNTFAPRIRIGWTPGQYYYMNGHKKVNLYSRFPTFILDYERGLPNVLHSTGVYERIELDLQHHIRIGLLSHLYYRIGAGSFTNQDETFFVDYANFRKQNLPEDRNDEIGGMFQALESRWYNASLYYVKGHITYEAPFLFMRHLLKYTSHIRHERLYLNMLTMEHLNHYMELGYGIDTFVFDMGLFVSLESFNKVGFGYKFTFELFNK